MREGIRTYCSDHLRLSKNDYISITNQVKISFSSIVSILTDDFYVSSTLDLGIHLGSVLRMFSLRY